MELVLNTVLSYIVSLAVNFRTDAIFTRREENLKEQLAREDDLRKAIASSRSLRDELRASCVELARNLHRRGIPQAERPVWNLLSNESFQDDLAEWLMAGGIEEGAAVRSRLLKTMEAALAQVDASPEKIAFLRDGYFECIEKAVFAHPVLAHWRHQLSLDYLREQVVGLRRRAEEAAGVYSLKKQSEVIEQYCAKALDAWDIIDLSNLPEGDIHMATQQLLLRQLYMPLRIVVEPNRLVEGEDAALASLEEQRELRRRHEAGHFFMDDLEHPLNEKSRAPVGERLGASRRLVVLGDPGGGKTTMLRWMATAYLLKIKGDAAFSLIPDSNTLPEQSWIPVLIRCRDLGRDDLCRSFKDFLTQHLNKSKLLPEEAGVMLAIILDRLAKGEVLLLIDGLDEITDAQVRTMFCQELEHTAARYPHAPIVVTSRVVGYRDMPYRISSGFEHGLIAELDRKDKDLFAKRWVEVTEQKQPEEEKARRVGELLEALHSSDRIERLTGNPMLLTTLALVKRKVGKLPNKRTKLYAEAVSVLLNWNPRFYAAIEEDEAIPQLEYLAYEMCRRGVQRLTEEEVLDLLDKLRSEYPNIRAVRRRDPEEFLAHLEARSSILIKSGGVWQKNEIKGKPVWEFRHLTFQEYLAARALLDGRYPDRKKTKSLAEQVAPLAGALESSKGRRRRSVRDMEADIPESWREALRLLVAECKDDDVDDTLLAIVSPLDEEDTKKTARPRAVLAALCLADEPNISEKTAQMVIDAFVKHVGSGLEAFDAVHKAAIEIGASLWSVKLKQSLFEIFCRYPSGESLDAGGLLATLEGKEMDRLGLESSIIFNDLVRKLRAECQFETICAALATMEAAYEGKAVNVEGLVPSLFALLQRGGADCLAAAWALFWLSSGGGVHSSPVWLPSDGELDALIANLNNASKDEGDLKRFLVRIVGMVPGYKSFSTLIPLLDDIDAGVRESVVRALPIFSEEHDLTPLLANSLNDQDVDVRLAAIESLEQAGGRKVVDLLLSKLDEEDVGVRLAVIRALDRLGDNRAMLPLLERINDKDSNVRMAIIRALGGVGDSQALVPLLKEIDDKDIGVRRSAVRALGELGDPQALAPLLDKLEGEDSGLRLAVIEAIGELGDERAVEPLLRKLGDQDDYVRWAVVEVLGRLGCKKAVVPLMPLLEDLNSQVKLAAAASLLALGVDEGGSVVKSFLEDGDSSELREDAVAVLLRFRENPRERVLLSRDLDGLSPWHDPSVPISKMRIAAVAAKLGISVEEAHAHYKSIADDFCLKLE